eukprot:1146329-Pelagomonas_calceolata.AAC.5
MSVSASPSWDARAAWQKVLLVGSLPKPCPQGSPLPAPPHACQTPVHAHVHAANVSKRVQTVSLIPH